ncbi:hypothetical protein [Psychroserpens sp. Hel_I_66]|uniref:hypothetical protein n=1 Tax=Psychroserpens sp. Hel_I_66 TaxID=1250004 RepID=UPI000AEA0E73|nr:hypothetical protein [Psychroserpens sp. Hel_I_66]
MSTDKDKNKEKEDVKKTGISENAINKKEVDGRDINHQQKDRREIHQPRDNA